VNGKAVTDSVLFRFTLCIDRRVGLCHNCNVSCAYDSKQRKEAEEMHECYNSSG
jgi:hypothetical protein